MNLDPLHWLALAAFAWCGLIGGGCIWITIKDALNERNGRD